MPGDPLARRLIIGLAGPRPSAAEIRWIAHHRPAGVILFSRNITGYEALRRMTRDLSGVLPPGAEIVADHEGGPISVLAAALGCPPAPWALGLLDDPDLTRAVHRETGRWLKEAGIRRVLAPVADVLVEPRNPVIGARAFGADPGRVARHVAAAVTGLGEGGVAVCPKHWPGHGGTAVDSHAGTAPPGRGLLAEPFRAALAAGADSLMLGHLSDPAAADALPATLSPEAAKRARALAAGRSLLLWSDDVTMGALRPPLAAAGILPSGDPGAGLLDPARLPRSWFEALAEGGCDRWLCRGIPWEAFPGPGRERPASGSGLPEEGKCWPGASLRPPEAEPYRQARDLLARRSSLGPFPPGEGDLLWLDATTGDSWGEAADLLPLLEACTDRVERLRLGAAPSRSAWQAVLVTSHRPLAPEDLRCSLPPASVPTHGEALVLGHPSLAADMKSALPEGWRLGAAFDVRPEDLRPFLSPHRAAGQPMHSS
jgi:hypothetical protein